MLLWGTQGSQIPIMLPTKQYIQCKYPSSLLARGSLSQRTQDVGCKERARLAAGVAKRHMVENHERATQSQKEARQSSTSLCVPCQDPGELSLIEGRSFIGGWAWGRGGTPCGIPLPLPQCGGLRLEPQRQPLPHPSQGRARGMGK